MDMHDIRKLVSADGKTKLCVSEQGYIFLLDTLTKESTLKDIEKIYNSTLYIVGLECDTIKMYQFSALKRWEFVIYDHTIHEIKKQYDDELSDWTGWSNQISIFSLLAETAKEQKKEKGGIIWSVQTAYKTLLRKNIEKYISEQKKKPLKQNKIKVVRVL